VQVACGVDGGEGLCDLGEEGQRPVGRDALVAGQRLGQALALDELDDDEVAARLAAPPGHGGHPRMAHGRRCGGLGLEADYRHVTAAQRLGQHLERDLAAR